MILNRILCLICLSVLAACSSPQADWEAAQSEDSAAAYEAFLAKHPDSEFTSQAQARLDELNELAAWDAAREADTAKAYREYIKAYKDVDGAHVKQARKRLKGLREQTAWEKAREQNTARAYRDFLADYPDGDNAERARNRLAKLEQGN